MRFDLASRLRRALAQADRAREDHDDESAGRRAVRALPGATAAWTAGSVRINAAYEQDAKRAGDRHGGRYPLGAIDAIAAEIQRLVILLTPDLRQWALSVERVQRGKFVSSVLSATDVDLDTILTAGDVEDTVAARSNWNVSLIRDVSDELRRRIANASSPVSAAGSAAEIAREIRDAIGMARARARRIAGDQTVKLGERLNQARQEQAGLTHFKWRHSASVTRASGTRRATARSIRGRAAASPQTTCPECRPFCGCTAQGVVVFEE
jgi:hypothetical protein